MVWRKLGEAGEPGKFPQPVEVGKLDQGHFRGQWISLTHITATLLFCSQFEPFWWTPSLGISYLCSGAGNISRYGVRSQKYFPTTLSPTSKFHREVDLRHTWLLSTSLLLNSSLPSCFLAGLDPSPELINSPHALEIEPYTRFYYCSEAQITFQYVFYFLCYSILE